jgi:thiol-disulfide isomerase/thioredoxin
MTLVRTAAILGCLLLAATFLIFPNPGTAHARTKPSQGKRAPVWIVFFGSPECEKCASVKEVIKALKEAYPLRVKSFNIDRSTDRATFRDLEAIHAPGKFAVPLVLIDDTILMGDEHIAKDLAPLVRKLSRSGGAPLPYLGPQSKKKTSPEPPAPCYECEQRGRPPDVRDELKKIRTFIDRFR